MHRANSQEADGNIITYTSRTVQKG